ncbi:MAG: succinylglutamate desuccinylase/aspartoacylase family protein [Anaerolineales bacterium]
MSYFRVPYSRDTSAWGALLIPIIVIKHGVGPTVLLVGGVHGGEYEGPVSLLKLCRELQPEQVHGRVIILPALNLPAVQAGKRTSPIDDKDMNRVFPGRWNGTVTEIIAHYVHEAILPLCDAVVDLHSGGYSLNLLPYMSMHFLEDQEQTERTLAALKAFDAPVGLIMREFTGEGLLDYAVERMGKVFLSGEMGGLGTLSPQALKITEIGVKNVLKHFNIIEGEIVTRESQGLPPARLMEAPDAEHYCIAQTNGIYESFFELGDRVAAGQMIGQVHFVETPGREPEVIVAQRAGMLIGARGPGFVERADCVALVARDVM